MKLTNPQQISDQFALCAVFSDYSLFSVVTKSIKPITIAQTDKSKVAVAVSTARNLRSRSQPPVTVTASSLAKISKKTLVRKRTVPNPSPLRQSIILPSIKETQSARPTAGPSSIQETETLPHIPDLTPSRSSSPSQRTRSPSPAQSTQSCPTDFTITRHAIPSYQISSIPALQFPSFAEEESLPDSRYNSLTRSPSPTIKAPSSFPTTGQNSHSETPSPSDPPSPINNFPSSIIPTSRMTTLAIGRAAMPAPGSNRAPKTFDGSEDDIADFLELFENCADDTQLPDKEREQIITEDERDRYYWFGFHQDTRKILERQLTTTIPDHLRSKVYRSADVFRAGKYLFDVDAFDRNPPEGLAPPESESKPQGGSVEVRTRMVTLPAAPMSAPTSHNMEDLLLRIKSLSVKEPEYAAMYAKIQATSPITADLLKQPYGMVNSAVMPAISPCMFCKDSVNLHRTRQCSLAQEYLRLKKISLSTEGYWRWPNGDRIASHPQGMKFVIDQAEARTTATAGAATQAQVQSFVLTVDPIKNPIMASSFIEEIPDDSANTFVAQTTRKVPPAAPGATSVPSLSALAQPSEKKAPQYQYQSKIEDPKAV
ncbi:hypothetical protein M422DRAFT_269053 [Sphaerobolus stellatus SS14]|uniref:Uncharacterized protein n=1 Tax=Sphaerobolus stellatus (strain SS14) TaxID=990650 RepID=A0A0C9UWJ4_SPHS4|nr:hypothetical protein M422DRAFT_269053 [Sphaerobolus stellatus SS14]